MGEGRGEGKGTIEEPNATDESWAQTHCPAGALRSMEHIPSQKIVIR